MSLAVRIKVARAERRLSQRALAEAMGVSVQAVSQWETEKTSPDLSRLTVLAGVLGVDFEWLCGLSGSESAVPPNFGKLKNAPFVSRFQVAEFAVNNFGANFQYWNNQSSVETTFEFPGTSFAVWAERDDVGDGFKDGDLLVFNNSIAPSVGDVVIVFAVTHSLWKVAVAPLAADMTVTGYVTHLPLQSPDGQRHIFMDLSERNSSATIIGTLIECRTFPRGRPSSG